jgi:hypothetical protein
MITTCAIEVGLFLSSGAMEPTVAGDGRIAVPGNRLRPLAKLFDWMHMRRLSLQILSVWWLLAGPAYAFAQSTASGSESTGKSPAFAYVVASLSALLIMLILCMPSRKR